MKPSSAESFTAVIVMIALVFSGTLSGCSNVRQGNGVGGELPGIGPGDRVVVQMRDQQSFEFVVTENTGTRLIGDSVDIAIADIVQLERIRDPNRKQHFLQSPLFYGLVIVGIAIFFLSEGGDFSN